MVRQDARKSDPHRVPLYRMIWRWHFYAGLFVLPFILVLSVTGAAYLFKPQLDRWEERTWRGLPAEVRVSPDAQLASTLAATPGGRLRFRSEERRVGRGWVSRCSCWGGTVT